MPIDPFFLEQMAGEPDRESPEQLPACPECGYDLRGTPTSRPCPECGWRSMGARAGAEDAPEEDHGHGTPCIKCGTPIVGMPFGGKCPDCAGGRPHAGRKAQPCSGCGYDLTGLGIDAVCPECGAGADTARRRTRPSLALPAFSDVVLGSLRMQIGTLLLVLVGSGWFLLTFARTLGLLDEGQWLLALQVTSVALVLAACCTSPGSADGPAKLWMLPLRWAMRLALIGFPLAVFLDPSTLASVVLSLIGLVGLAMLQWLLAMYARVIDLEKTSRRYELGWIFCMPCGIAAWLLPFPGEVANLPANAMGYVVMFIMLFMLIPTWMMCWLMFRPSLTMWSTSVWSARNVRQQSALIARRRLEPKCPACGYMMKGLDPDSPCPECGRVT